jgi:kynureninase
MELGPFVDDPAHDRAVELDAAEPLTQWRDRFVIEDPEMIYLDGNSLGRLPRAAAPAIDDAVHRQWGQRLIRSWNDGWWDLQIEIGDILAPTIGASPGEVIVSDSTSVNLYKLALGALRARPDRTTVVTDDLNFPSDLYILESAAAQCGAGHRVEIVESDGLHGPVEALLAAIDDTTALVSLSATTFKSGYTYDMAAIARAAHDHGALVLWDLSHSAGVIDQGLNATDADLAVGCTYKYLNGGPGSPAFLYVRADLQAGLENPVHGWFAHEDPFAFDLDFRSTDGPRKFHVGTMPMLSLVATRVGAELAAEAGVASMRRASMSLTAWAEQLFDEMLAPLGFEFATPRDPERRGSHVSLAHDRAWQLTQALIDVGQVLPDFRAPNHLRLGFAPVYTTHVEIHTAFRRLAHIVESRIWEGYPETASAVT